MSYPTLSGVPTDTVLESAHGVGMGSLLLMIMTRRGSCGTGVELPKAGPVGVAIGAISNATMIGLGETSPLAEAPPQAGGRNSVKFVV